MDSFNVDNGHAISRLGTGIKTLNHEFVPNSVFDDAKIKVVQSAPKVTVVEKVFKSESELNSSLGLTQDTHVEGEIYNIDLTLASKSSFAKSITVDAQSIFISVTKRVEYTVSFGGNVVMREDIAPQLKAPGALYGFYLQYGDKYVSQITYGYEAIAVIKLDSRAQLSKTTLDSDNQLNAEPHMRLNATVSGGVHISAEDMKTSSAGGCWIYITGVTGTATFIPNAQNLGSLLDGIYNLFKFDQAGNQNSPVPIVDLPLSCQLLPYSRAIQSFNSSQIFLGLENKMRFLRGYSNKIKRVLELAKEYEKKYDISWKRMNDQIERFKESTHHSETGVHTQGKVENKSSNQDIDEDFEGSAVCLDRSRAPSSRSGCLPWKNPSAASNTSKDNIETKIETLTAEKNNNLPPPENKASDSIITKSQLVPLPLPADDFGGYRTIFGVTVQEAVDLLIKNFRQVESELITLQRELNLSEYIKSKNDAAVKAQADKDREEEKKKLLADKIKLQQDIELHAKNLAAIEAKLKQEENEFNIKKSIGESRLDFAKKEAALKQQEAEEKLKLSLEVSENRQKLDKEKLEQSTDYTKKKLENEGKSLNDQLKELKAKLRTEIEKLKSTYQHAKLKSKDNIKALQKKIDLMGAQTDSKPSNDKSSPSLAEATLKLDIEKANLRNAKQDEKLNLKRLKLKLKDQKNELKSSYEVQKRKLKQAIDENDSKLQAVTSMHIQAVKDIELKKCAEDSKFKKIKSDEKFKSDMEILKLEQSNDAENKKTTQEISNLKSSVQQEQSKLSSLKVELNKIQEEIDRPKEKREVKLTKEDVEKSEYFIHFIVEPHAGNLWPDYRVIVALAIIKGIHLNVWEDGASTDEVKIKRCTVSPPAVQTLPAEQTPPAVQSCSNQHDVQSTNIYFKNNGFVLVENSRDTLKSEYLKLGRNRATLKKLIGDLHELLPKLTSDLFNPENEKEPTHMLSYINETLEDQNKALIKLIREYQTVLPEMHFLKKISHLPQDSKITEHFKLKFSDKAKHLFFKSQPPLQFALRPAQYSDSKFLRRIEKDLHHQRVSEQNDFVFDGNGDHVRVDALLPDASYVISPVNRADRGKEFSVSVYEMREEVDSNLLGKFGIK